MFGSSLSIDSLLSGSLVRFRERVHPDSGTDQFRELQRDKERVLGTGIDQLRRIRTQIFESSEPSRQQSLLKLGVALADQIADYCLADGKDRAAALDDHSYHRVLESVSTSFVGVEPQSKHHIVPSLVAQNLRRAAQDILIRVEEEVTSLTSPSKRLSDSETLKVLFEFLSGTNNLSVEAKKDLFLQNTKVAGLLSGGLVYALMAKKVAERYGNESGTGMNVIAAAVDADGKRAVFERGPDDPKVGRLIVVDDMINKGGSILCAAHAAEDVFTGATINSGLYYSYAEGRIPPSQKKHRDHLAGELQDFADLTESTQLDKAREVLIAAYEYACKNEVTLQRGWYKRAARYFEDSVALIGKEPST